MPNEIMKSSEQDRDRQSLFNYNSSHNNFPAIESLNPIDIGTERQFWFTANMLADMLGVDAKTIRNRVNTLENIGDLSGKNFSLTKLPDSRGSLHETTIYDLTTFNKLVMTMIDNPIAVNARAAFNDVIVKVETTGSYNAIQLDRKTQLQLAIINSKPNSVEQLAAIAALEELHAEEKKALEDKTKELEDENEIIRGEYYNTKQIYDIIMQEYPEALQQAKTTNYNKLRKALKKLSNEDKESCKVYKKHVTNSQDNIEWRQEYYFVKKILLKVLDCISDNIKYIANIR